MKQNRENSREYLRSKNLARIQSSTQATIQEVKDKKLKSLELHGGLALFLDDQQFIEILTEVWELEQL